MRKLLIRLSILFLLAFGIAISPVAKADLDHVHDKLWNTIFKEIEKNYPLPGSVSWESLRFESRNHKNEVMNLGQILHKIRTNKNNEAKACLLFRVHNNMMEHRSLAIGSYDSSKIKPEWYAKAKQLKKIGVEIHNAGAPEAIMFYYRGSLGNEIRKIKGTHCSQVYRLYSYQKEQRLVRRNMTDQEWTDLEFNYSHHFLTEQGWNNEERGLIMLYKLSLMLDKWTNCGLFDPTQEEIDRFWEQRYTEKVMVKRIIAKINELQKHLSDSKDTDKLLYIISQKLPIDEGWPGFCEPDDV